MTQYTQYKAGDRGYADHGWLKSAQSFSFSGYYNAERLHFGALRVLNDDWVAGGKGFGRHPHDNMEIISLPLEGALVHKDNLGNEQVVQAGELQVMSTGKGVFHSEYNADPEKPAQFLQIWVFPQQLNTEPRYQHLRLQPEHRQGRLQTILSPTGEDGRASINQEAWFSLGRFDQHEGASYALHTARHGVYVFVISGSFLVNGQVLGSKDALGIEGVDMLHLAALEAGAEILLIEVPLRPQS
ncbi:MAG: pirin family protein [Candidatus Pseudobacter hemicellulosilyticus]|uniref:Pirin family protein n=1 Tax=Candidatus Pseudobacter hemicellulosilyticus TaxID=3121375 RepID=A0AAJ5WWB9_9BACT|nr:MAG: pirin family protein [Pseudobacter sp.]